MLELLENGDGYIYNDLNIYKNLIDFTTTNIETVNKTCIYSISKINLKQTTNLVNFSYSNYKLKCPHEKIIDYLTANKLPREGWEELIECWSCHDNEFKTMLDLNIKPRQKGILVSDLYFLINDCDLPFCCSKNKNSIRKIFFNEIKVEGYSDQNFLYNFFMNYFKSNSLFFYESGGKSYEINFFYHCTIVLVKDGKLDNYKAMKVGVKETEKKVSEQNFINDYFKTQIQKSISKIGVEVLNYEVGFIIKMN